MERIFGILVAIGLAIGLVISFWQIILILLIAGVLIRLLYIYICECLFCFHCEGTGKLNKYDTALQLSFRHDEPCYMCGGHGIPAKHLRRWHNIARDAELRIRQLDEEEQHIQREIARLRSMQFSDRTSEHIAISYGKMLEKKNKQLESIDAERAGYEEARLLAHNNLYNLHLHQKMQKEQQHIDNWDARRTDTLGKGVDLLKDVKFTTQYDMPLLESSNLDYLELVSEPMKRNIEKTTAELRALRQNGH